MSESRKFQRTQFEVSGVVFQSGNVLDFGVKNISLKGALIHCPEAEKLDFKNPVELAIQLTHSEIQIKAEALIVHHEVRDEMKYQGCKFISIDPESMIHLRRLLELNTIPEGEIEKELSFLKE